MFASPAAPAATDFTAAWEAFSRATRRARGRSTGPLSEGGLTLAQYHLLESMLDGRERTVSEMALAAGVAAPTATRMLDPLVRDGHVARRPSEHDRRAVPGLAHRVRADAVRVAERARPGRRRRVRDSLTPPSRNRPRTCCGGSPPSVDEEL